MAKKQLNHVQSALANYITNKTQASDETRIPTWDVYRASSASFSSLLQGRSPRSLKVVLIRSNLLVSISFRNFIFPMSFLRTAFRRV